MTTSKVQLKSEGMWGLIRRQHGVVSYEQLSKYGLTPAAIRHRVAKGRLHRVHRGVYAVGRPELSERGRWMATVLACGPEAMLSHATAAALWGMRIATGRLIHVSVAVETRHRRRGLRVHRRAATVDLEPRVRDGIPLSGPVATLVDIAATTPGQLELAVNEADRLELVDPEALSAAIAQLPPRPGVGRLRQLLERQCFALTDSALERRFLRIVRAAGLVPPRTQQWVNGFRVDFYWPDLGLVVETDGLRYHRTPSQQARDRRRDQAHTSAGVANLRFAHAQVRFEPEHVRAVLERTIEELLNP